MKNVFCDESGATGNNLWQVDQPHFVYAAVAIDDSDAQLILDARRKYSIRAPEFHAAQLIKRQTGMKALIAILDQVRPASSVVVFHKRFCLAGKMFEYLIEPIISDKSSAFYGVEFHKFIANGLYFATCAGIEGAERATTEFQEMMRTGDTSRLDALIDALISGEKRGFLHQLATIILCNRPLVEEEIALVRGGDPVTAWMLELTSTALNSLLASISGAEMTPLTVTCDDSKPLLRQVEFFDAMIGRQDCQVVEFDGRRNQITFNLSQRIALGSSHSFAGIQIADIVASTAAFALKNQQTEFSEYWRKNCPEMLNPNSVLPDEDEFDPSKRRTVINSMLLQELESRSVVGRPLLSDLNHLLHFVHHAADEFLSDESQRQAIARDVDDM